MSEPSNNARLEAFCDGVFAIAMTLLIIDIKLPSPESITNTDEFWRALQHILPSVGAFVLSFTIILITWVNHHAALKMVGGTSGRFVYANGLLMLTVVFIPFPTSLLGEFITTDHSSPAVILYNGTLVLQSLGWYVTGKAAIAGKLWKHASAEQQTRKNTTYARYSMGLYSVLALLAVWFPRTIAVVTTLTWVYWLVHGLRTKHEA